MPSCHGRLRRHWPLVWGALTLLGQASGQWAAHTWPDVPPRLSRPASSWPSRLIGLAPLLLPLGTGVLLDVSVWSVTFAGAGILSWREVGARASRRSVEAPALCAPSHRLTWEAGASLRITSWPRRQGHGWRAAAVLLSVGQERRGWTGIAPQAGDGFQLSGRGPAPCFGAIVSGRIQARIPEPARLPGAYDARKYLAGRGLLWQGRLQSSQADSARPAMEEAARDPLCLLIARHLEPLRRDLLAGIGRGLPPREAQLAASVLLGEHSDGAAAARGAFGRLGLAHLFAVSGLHVGILVSVLLALGKLLAAGPVIRWLGVLSVLSVYGVIAGLSASVLRATHLMLLVMAAPLAGRRCDALHLLGLLFWANHQWSPDSLLDTGLRLSFLAAVGIVGVRRALAPRLGSGPRPVRLLVGGLLVTLSAQWFTLPEIACVFGGIHPLASLANLIAVPVFSAAVWMTVLALLLWPVSTWLGGALFAWAWLLMRLLTAGASALVRMAPWVIGIPVLGPGRLAGLVAGSAVLMLQLVHLGRRPGAMPRRNALICLALVLVLVGLLPLGRHRGVRRMSGAQFDVGQGDCGLLTFPDGWTVLIDTGGPGANGAELGRAVLPWLQREGIQRLGAVVLTHAHADHTGGAAELADCLRVDDWWLGGSARPPEELGVSAQRIHRGRRGDVVHECAPWSLVCLYPQDGGGVTTWPENDRSLVLGLRRGRKLVALWSGDLEQTGEAALLACTQDQQPGPLHIWKVGHHGSATSGSTPLLNWTRPQLVVISCGVDNRYGHPSHGPYVARGDTARIARTDLDGAVLWRWDAAGDLTWWTADHHRGRLRWLSPLP